MPFDETDPQWGFDPSLFANQDGSGYSDPSYDTGGGNFSGPIDFTGPLQSGNNPAISQIMKQLQAKGQPATNAANLGSILGAFSSGEKANRVTQGNFAQGYDQLMLNAQTGRNQTESDALKKLAQTSYLSGGGSQFKPASFQLNGKTVTAPDLGYGPKPASDAQKAGANSLQSQLQARLMPGGTYTPQPLDDYAKPGTAENIGSYGAAGVSGLGSLLDAFGSGGTGLTGQPGGASSMNGLTSALGALGTGVGAVKGMSSLMGGGTAAAGASGANGVGSSIVSFLQSPMGRVAGNLPGAALGAYGVAKNGSVGSDALSGAGSGASIGTMVMPGIGTAVGAGLGALVGAIRGLTSVTGKEQGGRDAQTAVVKQMTAQATPEQKAGAAQAGWPDPNQALTLIVMRDALTKSGVPGPQAESQAEAAMHSMWDAEKSGSDSVNQAANPMMAMLQGQGQPGGSPLGGAPSAPGGLITDAFSKNARG